MSAQAIRMNRGKFQRGRNYVVTCRCCGKSTHSSIDGCLGLDLCRDCLEEANVENARSDNDPIPLPQGD